MAALWHIPNHASKRLKNAEWGTRNLKSRLSTPQESTRCTSTGLSSTRLKIEMIYEITTLVGARSSQGF